MEIILVSFLADLVQWYKKFDFVTVGQIKELLNIGWSARKIKQHMLKYGVQISVGKISAIKNEKENQPPLTPSGQRGRKCAISKAKLNKLQTLASMENPPT